MITPAHESVVSLLYATGVLLASGTMRKVCSNVRILAQFFKLLSIFSALVFCAIWLELNIGQMLRCPEYRSKIEILFVVQIAVMAPAVAMLFRRRGGGSLDKLIDVVSGSARLLFAALLLVVFVLALAAVVLAGS